MFDTTEIKFVIHSELMPEEIREDYLDEFKDQYQVDEETIVKLDFALLNVEDYVNIAEEVIEELELSDSQLDETSTILSNLREMEKDNVYVNLDI